MEAVPEAEEAIAAAPAVPAEAPGEAVPAQGHPGLRLRAAITALITTEHPDEIHLVVYYTVELSQMFDWLDLKVNMCKETRARAWLAGWRSSCSFKCQAC